MPANTSTDPEQRIVPELCDGEVLLWAGRYPFFESPWVWCAVLLTPVYLLGIGPYAFAPRPGEHTADPLLLLHFIPTATFFLWALALELQRRYQTVYGVTSRRVLVSRRGGRELSSVFLGRVVQARVEADSTGAGQMTLMGHGMWLRSRPVQLTLPRTRDVRAGVARMLGHSLEPGENGEEVAWSGAPGPTVDQPLRFWLGWMPLVFSTTLIWLNRGIPGHRTLSMVVSMTLALLPLSRLVRSWRPLAWPGTRVRYHLTPARAVTISGLGSRRTVSCLFLSAVARVTVEDGNVVFRTSDDYPRMTFHRPADPETVAARARELL